MARVQSLRRSLRNTTINKPSKQSNMIAMVPCMYKQYECVF